MLLSTRGSFRAGRRGRSLLTAAVAVLAAAGGLAVATPAQARAGELGELYQNNHVRAERYLRPKNGAVNGPATLGSFAGWRIHHRSVINGHPMVVMQSVEAPGHTNGRCLDSHASLGGGAAWVHGCNQGVFQDWEIFTNANGSVTFKSWGAWARQRQHLCLGANSAVDVVMLTCDTGSDWQQWVKPPPA